MTETVLLKEHLNEQAVSELATQFKQVWPDFDERAFYLQATNGLASLELKARVQHIIQALKHALPQHFDETANILLKLAYYAYTDLGIGWHYYIYWPVIDYVAEVGLDDPDLALNVLENLTPLFTAEFAMRPFIDQHFELTCAKLVSWTTHHNEHVRRLASEAMRPRLPWANQLSFLRENPTRIFPILEALKEDESLYVRRSVANNLNDISKDYPEDVLALCEEWQRPQSKQTSWIIRHGLRTLVKQGHPRVFPLLGYSELPNLSQISCTLSDLKIHEGETLTINLVLQADRDAKCVLDYKIGFVGAKGQTNWKVFKWCSVDFIGGETIALNKKRTIRSYSTRHLHPGLHFVQCLLNGECVAQAQFELVKG
jgi:3-methyladenine DNA glycosylase AlkC